MICNSTWCCGGRRLPFPPSFLVELMREFVNFAASSGVFWGCSAAKSVVQPTIEHTRRTAAIAATNNDNHHLISTLWDLIKSYSSNLHPDSIYGKLFVLACFSHYFCITSTLQMVHFPSYSPIFSCKKRPKSALFRHKSLLAER